MQMQAHKSFDKSEAQRPWIEALIGGACGLAMAAVLVVAFAFIFTAASRAQDPARPDQQSARIECEAGARNDAQAGRALGACDLLLRDSAIQGEDRARVLTNRAVMLLARGLNGDARRDLEQATELAPDLAEAWLNLSAAQIGTGSARAALESAAQAVTLGADPALGAFNTAIALETLGQYEEAYQAYAEAAQHAPDNATLAAQPARFVWHQPGAEAVLR